MNDINRMITDTYAYSMVDCIYTNDQLVPQTENSAKKVKVRL